MPKLQNSKPKYLYDVLAESKVNLYPNITIPAPVFRGFLLSSHIVSW